MKFTFDSKFKANEFRAILKRHFIMTKKSTMTVVELVGDNSQIDYILNSQSCLEVISRALKITKGVEA